MKNVWSVIQHMKNSGVTWTLPRNVEAVVINRLNSQRNTATWDQHTMIQSGVLIRDLE